MKRFFIFILFILIQTTVTVATLSASSKFDYKFTCDNKMYAAAVDKAHIYVEYEGRDYLPVIKGKNYIITWENKVYLVESEEAYNLFLTALENIKKNTGRLSYQLGFSLGHSVIAGTRMGAYGRWKYIGYYDENYKFIDIEIY